jgi:tetratricopeptide (TPR) repeat protein
MKNLLLAVAVLASSHTQALNPDSSSFYFNKGLQEKNNKRLLVASQAFDKAILFNPQFKEAYLENAQVLMEMRQVHRAKENFTKLYELDPANKVAIKELTELYYNYNEFDKAIEFAKKCTECENASRIVGMSLYKQEDYAAAEKALLAALARNPLDAEATYTLARNYLDMEAYKKAVPWYEKAVNMTGSKSSWMYELGLLYYNNNDYKNSVIAFEKAAANGYEQKNDFNENLGFASLYAGDFLKGEKLLLGILQRKPNNSTLMRDMAEIFYGKQQYDKSLEYCQKLMELDAKDGKALYQAGLCFQKKGQKDRGQQMCDKAIEMDPSLANLRKKKEMPGNM